MKRGMTLTRGKRYVSMLAKVSRSSRKQDPILVTTLLSHHFAGTLVVSVKSATWTWTESSTVWVSLHIVFS